MKILVTGSSGHLGEALIRSLRTGDHDALGVDIKESPFTNFVGSIVDRKFVKHCVSAADAIIHTATLHKPHVGTHSRQDFVDTNITGTLNLLEAASETNCSSFIFTSTTSTFGSAMKPSEGDPAIWVTEELQPKPKNIYGITKLAAEDLCCLFHQKAGLPCVVLKTSRFFPEQDDTAKLRESFSDDNLKVNELSFRRGDLADIVTAHQLALAKAEQIGFDKFIVSSTTPFERSDAAELGLNAPAVLARRAPSYLAEYARRNWTMFPTIDRVYDNTKARNTLEWEPTFTFKEALERLTQDMDYRSQLAQNIGKKGYHDVSFDDGPYPIGDF